MEMNCSPLVRIYQSVYALMVFKRRLFQEIALPHLPSSPFAQQQSSAATRVFFALKKLASEVKSQLPDIAEHGKFQDHLSTFRQNLRKLKSNTDCLTREEKLLSEAAAMVDQWQKVTDPLIFYQQGAREELREKVKEKMAEMAAAVSDSQQTKKSAYVRRLERELRDNLEAASDQERKFNRFQDAVGELVRQRLAKTSGKLLQGLRKASRPAFSEEQKNELLRKYIDIFNSTERKQKEQAGYVKDAAKVAVNTFSLFANQKQCWQLLLEYLRALLGKLQSARRNIVSREDEVASQACSIPQDISSVLCFPQALEIFANAKDFLSFSVPLQEFINKVEALGPDLEQALSIATRFSRETKCREEKRVSVDLFISDKRTLEELAEREVKFEIKLQKSLVEFVEAFVQRVTHTPRRETKSEEACKLRTDKILQKMFSAYFQESQAFQRRKSTQGLTLSSSRESNSSKMAELQAFLRQLLIFQQDIDWSDSFQCSLGPKLLIHGRMKVLPSGLYYESNFNKKNLFFGKTRLFVPREELHEVNRERALVVFADVVEVITRLGPLRFHALGKREAMCSRLNDQFFPEINNPSLLEEDIPFNSFDGSSSIQERKVKAYLSKLEYQIQSGEIANMTFRSFFHKYESDQQFSYQGKTYPDFKHFSLQLAGGTDIQASPFSPPLPSYLTLAQSTNDHSELPEEDPAESERCFIYNKIVPMIPLLSKGGEGACKERCVYHWGGPKCLVIDSFTTLSGFSLAEGMTVHSRRVYKEEGESLNYQLSGTVIFESNSATNSLLRTPALANLKAFHSNIFSIIKRLQKNKRPRSIGSMKKIIMDEQEQSQEEKKQQQQIEQLKQQNHCLRQVMKKWGVGIICLYLLTLILILH